MQTPHLTRKSHVSIRQIIVDNTGMENLLIRVRVFTCLLLLLAITATLPAEILTMNTIATGEYYKADRGALNKQLTGDDPAKAKALAVSDTCYNRPQLVKLLANTRKIVLTFDDGPHPKTTPKVLEILRRRHIKAIFFVLGLQAAKYPDLIKQIHDEGHLIGNHSYSHKNLPQLSEAGMREELVRTSNLIESITGSRPEYLRPPYGSMNSKVIEVARQEGMKIVLWTIDPKDWLQKNEKSILRHTEQQLGMNSGRLRGGALLLHDIYPSTVRALEPLLDRLAMHEYMVASIDNLDAESGNFWSAAAPKLLCNARFFRRFDPELSGHDLLISLLKPQQKNPRTPMSILKARKSGELLAYLIKTPCKKVFNQQHSL